MKQKPGIVLKELGSKLKNLPTSKETLIHILEQAATALSECDQSPSKPVLISMQPFMDAVVKPELLKHQDGDVKLLVATCICEITRITAPEAPYGDDVLKDIFHLIVSTFSGLTDTSEPSFGRRAVILKTLADFRSCVVMLDLECNDLINKMFSTILAVASDGHAESVLNSMQTIMAVLLEESEEIQEDLLLVLLSVLGRNKKDITTAGRKLAMNVIEQCSEKLELGIRQFLISSISDDNRSLNCQIDYHEVIYDIYQCAPQVLSEVVPYIRGELLTDSIDIRLKAVRLVGDLLSLPKSAIPEIFQPIYSEFLKRLTDRAVEVQMAVLEQVKRYLLSNPSEAEAPQIISALSDRLLDNDPNVRKQVVAVLCDVACCSLNSISVETIKLVAERLTDKTILVKNYTMERLAEIYSKYCLECSNRGSDDGYDWIPGKILRCFYDRDFRSDAVEPILCSSLFPNDFSVKDKVRKWVRFFPRFDRIEIKALEKILEQKQRLQQEMLRYLSLRQMHQENDVPEFRKKAMTCFRIMSRNFIDPGKAEENFIILDELKDADVWKNITTLLDPSTTCLQACCSRDDVLKILGEKHRLYEFLSALSMKCSYLLFNKEHVKEILQEADMQKSAGSAEFTLSCMNILVILACSIPLVLSGIEEDFVHLLEDDNEIIKEGILHVLAKAGGTIRDQLRISSSSLDLILERICLEGSRRQAKYAVHALAAVTKDEGLMSLSVLYKRLLDMLKETKNLPAVLQSLGCIAEIAMPVFETRESEIETFIKREILQQKHIVEEKAPESWDERSELCSLKIFACKTLVKSYLPVRDAQLRRGIDDLLMILKSILFFGESSRDIESSSVDKAHMKLAGAKCILRLSRYWDQKIPIDLFYAALRISEVDFPQVKKLFLRKVHQYIKDRLLDPKYACAFLSNIEPEKQDFEEEKHNLYDIIQTCHQVKARDSVSDAASSVVYPEFILPYLVHAIAHHSSCPSVDECKDVKSFEPVYRRLYMFLSMLVHANENDNLEDKIAKEESISMIISIFQSIKLSEDSVDTTKSKNSHGICDLGLSIIKRLAKRDIQQDLSGSTSLPSMLYKKHESNEGEPLVNKGKTWLADDDVVSHFDSLNLEANETVLATIAEDEDIKDSDTDENEVPLGKMIKRLRAKSMNAKKILKDEPSLPSSNTKNEPSPPLSNTKNDIDIMRMVREMDLDTEKLERSGLEHMPEKFDDQLHKHSKRKTGVLANVPVPKRQRSSSAQAHHTQSLPKGSSKRVASFSQGKSTFDFIRMDDKLPSDLEENNSQENLNVAESDSSASILRERSNFSKPKGRGSAEVHNGIHKPEESTDRDLKIQTPTKHKDTDGLIAGTDSRSGSAKKRKRRSIAGLEKCTSKEGEHTTADLVDCRVKIWWPLDKQFYEGVVKSYDQDNDKHVIKYDDGDIEVLCLAKERWELVAEGRKTTKRVNISKGRSAKGLSSTEKRKKSSGGSRERKLPIKISPSSKVRGKRTPRKNLRHSQKRVSKSISAEFGDDSRHSPGGLDNEPVVTLKAEESETEEEHSNKMEESFGADDDPIKHEISVSKEPQVDAENSGDTKMSNDEGPDCEAKDNYASESRENHAEETQEAAVSREGGSEIATGMQKSNSQGIQKDDADSYQMGSDESAKIHSATNASEEENSDNEPLGAWKGRVGKSVAGK